MKEHAPEVSYLPNMQERWPQIKSGVPRDLLIIQQNQPQLPVTRDNQYTDGRKQRTRREREKTTTEDGKVGRWRTRRRRILEALERADSRQMMLIEEATPDGKVISLEVKLEKDQPEEARTGRRSGWRIQDYGYDKDKWWLCC